MAKGETLWEACERCAKEVATWPAWKKGGPNYRVIEGEEIAMSRTQLNKPNMEDQIQRLPVGKEQKLPPLDVNMDDLEASRADRSKYKRASREGLVLALYSRERNMAEALSQIATLLSQVEGLERGRKLDYAVANKELSRALKSEAEVAAMSAKVEELQADFDRVFDNCTTQHERALKSEAELATLRERNCTYCGWKPFETHERILDATGETK